MKPEERQMYLLHSQNREFAARLKSARTIMDKGFAAMQAPFASLSFGKDSMVMVHLLLQRAPDLPVLYVNCGKWDEWPDTPRVKAAFLALFPGCNFIEVTAPSIMEAYVQAGWYIQDEEKTSRARKAQRDYGKSLGRAIDAAARKRGYDGSFIGIRKEESHNRQRLFAMRGSLYYAKTRRAWACCPLMHWTGRDVWAYTCWHGLPYNELYDLAPQGRELARNGAMFGSRNAPDGRIAFLRQMYPEWFDRFAAQFPQVREFT